MDISKGDIVAIIEPEYIDFVGGKWSEHFTDKKHYYRAIESQSNNGNFLAKNSKGRITHINRMNVIEIVR